MVFVVISENGFPDPLTILLIPIPRLMIPDPSAVSPDPTQFFVIDPWSHIPCYDPVILLLPVYRQYFAVNRVKCSADCSAIFVLTSIFSLSKQLNLVPRFLSVNGSITCNQAALLIVCYTAVFSVVTHRGGAVLHDTKHGCVADYTFEVIGSIWQNSCQNLVNGSWLWWIMRVVLASQKRGNLLNE